MIGSNKLYLIFVGGGLGNQMFQYAAARSLAIESNKQLVLIRILFNQDKDGRSYRLFHLILNQDVKVASKLQERKYWFLFRLRKKFMRMFVGWNDHKYEDSFRAGIYMVIPAYTYVPFISSKKKVCYMWGLFQSEKYFFNNADIVRTELKVKTLPSELNQKMLETIRNCNSVCIHIRRGDYMNNNYNDVLNICTENYYMEAVQYIKQKVINPIFFVFSNNSDEINWIKENYKLPNDSIYVDFNNPDYEELRLMYSCKHFILSNSSFSWWAQELCEYDKKIIVAPSRWVNGYHDPIDIYKQNWHIINVR